MPTNAPLVALQPPAEAKSPADEGRIQKGGPAASRLSSHPHLQQSPTPVASPERTLTGSFSCAGDLAIGISTANSLADGFADSGTVEMALEVDDLDFSCQGWTLTAWPW
jgi:hypothetical protein